MSVALVTGATGLVGSHIVDALLAHGWTVRALVRDPARARAALPAAVGLERGDVLDEASVARAADGAHVIFHAAANVLVRGGWDAYRLTNIEGTGNIIAAAERARARLLHVSSVAVYGTASRYDAARAGRRVDEDLPLAPLPERAHYARSKRESETLVLRAHEQGRVWASVVRPDVIYGRRDRQFVPRIARLLRARAPIPLLRGGRATMAIVHAANVAAGAVLAATTDVAGGRAYNLANDHDVSVRRFFSLAGEGLGMRPLLVPMPVWLARGLLRGARTVVRTLTAGRVRALNAASIDFIADDNPFTSDRARRELGWTPRLRPDEAVPDAFRWWRENAG